MSSEGEYEDLLSSSSSSSPSSVSDDGDGDPSSSGGGSSSSAAHQDHNHHNHHNHYNAHDGPPPPRPPLQNHFAPPFYGRPPTPLPPSPSLTSLLRPSRPTTPDPDPSDDDNNNHNNSNSTLPRPAAAPTVPTYEYHGFVLYLFSSLAFLMYLLWSYLPSPFLHALGIYYYPNRWWALAVPAFIVMLLCYVYVALAAYNTEMLTVPATSVETIVDGAGKLAVIDAKGRLKAGGGGGRNEKKKCDAGGRLRWREIWNEGTDAVMDIPLAGVCEVLYGEGREDDDDGGAYCHALHRT